jgi:hypothetical protein
LGENVLYHLGERPSSFLGWVNPKSLKVFNLGCILGQDMFLFEDKGLFTNYVYKKWWVGNSKISTFIIPKLVKIVCERPLFTQNTKKKITYLPLLLVLIPESPLDEDSVKVKKPRIGATEASKLLTINESMKFSLSSEIKFFGDLDSRNLADW